MKNILSDRRRSGVLAHISSLPSPYGIGDIGPSSIQFLEFLHEAGQSCWQFLPISPTNSIFDNSPYMSSSAFAGSPLLISPDLLLEDGLIDGNTLADIPQFSPYQTDYEQVRIFKTRLLEKAFTNALKENAPDISLFRTEQPWVEDYGLFMALKEKFNNTGWFEWPDDIARRSPEAVARYQSLCKERIDYFIFEQYVFARQWRRMHDHARNRSIYLIGDIPIYVGLDSVDVWAHQEIYTLDETTSLPSIVAGVPPDYFSETGQRWGNPLYRWNSDSQDILDKLDTWWTERFRTIYNFVDIARIDHFRGFQAYWAIPADCPTAIEGEWLPGPGAPFFDRVFNKLGHLEIIAEDLGFITDEVYKLRDFLGFPGMKVLQFAFEDTHANAFLPHNYDTSQCVVYTGTHDNDTSVGWFLSDHLDEKQRELVKCYANRQLHDSNGIHDDLIYMAFSSIASLAIVPMQDLLGFGSDCRMNTPGVATGNWRWRCSPEFLTEELAQKTAEVTARFSRHKDQSNEVSTSSVHHLNP